MSRLRVFIATTEGPSEIQSLIEEDPDIRSVVCLNGTTESLPISKGYDAFVRKPTGVIERLTGHRVYRMDVSRPITNGNSWQLGVYLAHWLQSQNRLAQRGERSDGIILATGLVNARDLSVEPVGHIEEKLTAAQVLFDEAAEEGLPVTVLIPQGEDRPTGDIAVDYIRSIRSTDHAIGLLAGAVTPPVREAPAPRPVAKAKAEAQTRPVTPTKSMSKRVGAIFGLAVLVGAAAAGGWAWQQGPSQWETLREEGRLVSLDRSLASAQWPALADIYRSYRFGDADNPDALNLTIVGEFPADGGRCAGLRFRETETRAEMLGQGADSGDLVIDQAIPCRLFFELQNKAPQTRHLWLAVEPEMDHSRFRARDERGRSVDQAVAPGESIRLEIRLPLYRQAELDYRIRAAAYDAASDEIAALVSGAREESKKALQALESYGVSVLNFTALVKGP